MKTISAALLDEISHKATQSPRKRQNFNFHDSLGDPLQRLLNAMEPGTYVQPHKHEKPDKREFFIILKGKAVVIIFDNLGGIKNHTILSPETQEFGIEIPARTWHTIIILEEQTVLFEVKDGPYEQISDKNFATWAPKENAPECQSYNKMLLKKLKLS